MKVKELVGLLHGLEDFDLKNCAITKEILDALDAQPIVHGHWKVLNILDYAQRPTGRKVGQCPFCGYLTGEFRRVLESHHELTNYCPNCGARMDEENGEDDSNCGRKFVPNNI